MKYTWINTIIVGALLLSSCSMNKMPIENAVSTQEISNENPASDKKDASLSLENNQAEHKAISPQEDDTKQISTETPPEQEEIHPTNTVKNVKDDTQKGLSVTKIYSEKEHLSDLQKLIINYFDTDYFFFNEMNYDSLQRYPIIYKGAQVVFVCEVEEIIESDSEKYKILVSMIGGQYGQHLVIEGEQGSTRIITGDRLGIKGTYTDVKTYTINQRSYTVPTIYVNDWEYNISMDNVAEFFDANDIKTIAKKFLGNDIKVRKFDYSNDTYMGEYAESTMYGYVVELDNQSNANFTKYFFDTLGGSILDLKSSYSITRTIEVAADFEHFILMIYDKDMQSLILEYYDSSLKKTWSTELEKINSCSMDYTANHIYLTANGYLYILDIDTGKESMPKKYVGEKQDIRKLEDGILLIGTTGTDGIMKTDLEGNVLWSGNLEGLEIHNPTLQYIENRYVVNYRYYNADSYGERFNVFDKSGNEIQTGYAYDYNFYGY
ncbi:MAG: hypothetical protein IKV97_02585 [Clostridia bacterium]|nr:hypothetical protein [Clostridia bacterium]